MIDIIPEQRLKAKIEAVLSAKGADFETQPVDTLELTYGGISGDFHEGLTRKSGGREPWYDRGTEMRNERQVSILSTEEMEDMSTSLGSRIEPGWLGENMILSGIPNMSYLPPRTLMFFESGATLRIDGYNAPCRLAGGNVAKHLGVQPVNGDHTRTDMALSFKDIAAMKRGLVAWVEREGTISRGEEVSIFIFKHWVYQPD